MMDRVVTALCVPNLSYLCAREFLLVFKHSVESFLVFKHNVEILVFCCYCVFFLAFSGPLNMPLANSYQSNLLTNNQQSWSLLYFK